MFEGAKGYVDLASLPEDERIKIIGETVIKKGLIVGVPTDDEPGKPERYKMKLEKMFPGIRVLEIRRAYPVKGIATLRVAPPNASLN